jgi:glycyl-tRNA synthetase beta chain
MSTFLLELRCEEIPANALPGARRQLAEQFGRRLADAGVTDATIRTLSTSLRLAVLIDGLPERQEDRIEDMMGPPARIAFADDGTPTKAAEGFARKVGLTMDQVRRVATDKGEYLAATVTHPGRAMVELLGEAVAEIIGGLRFPKMMRWGLGEHHFVRPVHGLIALFDAAVVPCAVFGLEAGRETVGHRVHAPGAVAIETAGAYVDAMRDSMVMVDPDERRSTLEERAAALAAEAGCRVHDDPKLVAEHVELVEWPGLIRGEIEARFLELPPEVVVSTLREHQKCLILENEAGELQTHFLAVIDRSDDPEGLIRTGNEWVIGARLADAGFFFAEDCKQPLEASIPGLERVEWHRVLGSLEDKAERVAALARFVADALGTDDPAIARAARLVKADLVTNMVGEFSELQGVMGGHYLRLEGADEALWTAARDHYVPVGFDGPLPASDLGRFLGLADRLDTVAGLFAVGEKPSGSKDPFGLRRACQGAVRIVAESQWDVDLHDVVARAVASVSEHSVDSAPTVIAAVTDFLADRVRRYLVDVIGVSGDTADAVMAAGWYRLPGLIARARALEGVRGQASFRLLAQAFKRVQNITADQPDGEVAETRFEMDAERDLWEAVQTFHRRLAELLPERRVDDAFAAMAPMADVLDQFFLDVLVMAEDPSVRTNRIALLKTLGRDFLTLADLSKLQIEGGDE